MISVFELFKIGIGPSSSHTVGPMKAAAGFVAALGESGALARTARLRVDLLGSLAWTGKGHDTDKAVLLGLAGESPDTVDADHARRIVAEAREQQRLTLPGGRSIRFDPETDIVFDTLSPTPQHPNTLHLSAFDDAGAELLVERWCSIGGGFVVREAETAEV